jgi:hypothetical protein
MVEGAFALLDCLGFKGALVRGAKAEELVGFLRDARDRTQKSKGVNALDLILPDVLTTSVAFVSDTVVVSVRSKTEISMPAQGKGYLIMLAAGVCIDIAYRFINGPFPLAMRGCVTYGKFLAEENFFVGEAVDEAATFAESSDGAFIWATPKAQDYFQNYVQFVSEEIAAKLGRNDERELIHAAAQYVDAIKRIYPAMTLPDELVAFDNLDRVRQLRYGRAILRIIGLLPRRDLLAKYPMPLAATGHVIDVGVLSPYLMRAEADPDPIIDKYLLSFGEPKDLRVLTKKLNTIRFLNWAREGAIAQTKDFSDQARRIQNEELGDQVINEMLIARFLSRPDA